MRHFVLPHSSDHVYRASLTTDGETQQDVLQWDSIIENLDETHDSKHKLSKANGTHLWSGNKVVSSDKTGHADKVRDNPEFSLAAQRMREKTAAR